MASPDTVDGTTSLALRAYAAAASQPAQASRLGKRAALQARKERDPESESIAYQALGIAARTAGDVGAAITLLRRAIRIAERAGLVRQAARCRISLGPTLQIAGHGARALRAFDEAVAELTGHDRAQAETQRATMLTLSGDHTGALVSLRRALPVLRRHGDTVWVARALAMRGLVRTYTGDFTGADNDFAEMERIYILAADDLNAAGARHNRGWAAAYSGDIVTALDRYEEAAQRFVELGIPQAELALDHAQVLLFAGLPGEARAIGEAAAESMRRSGLRGFLGDALLIVSEASLAAGEPQAALAAALDSRRLFRRMGRPGWVALAGYAATRARWGAGSVSPRALQLACEASKELTASRLHAAALDAQLIAGRTALALGRRSAARRELTIVSRARRRGTAEQRSRGWLAEALLRIDADQPSSALRALRAGLDVIDTHRATLGATELRAHASSHATDLATLGQRLAIESGRPSAVLEWTERWRAAALRLPPVRPPDDLELAADLGALREAHSELEKAAAEGRPTGELTRRRATIEQSVLRRTRRTSGPIGVAETIAGRAELAAVLGTSALVEIAAMDDRIYAVALVDGELSMHTLGGVQLVVSGQDTLRFALRRLAYRQGSAASASAARAAVARSAAMLDELLMAPLLPTITDRPVVVVPPGGLHTLPWSTLPSLSGRDVTIAPSATAWLRCARANGPRRKQVVLVGGPGLPGADSEIAAIAEMHRDPTVLGGENATAKAVMKALDGAALAHIAAHGTFRGDNPLFSSLTLADGPLTVYDFERLRRAPHRIVLSACDSGLAGVRAGDELMGLAAALFPLGTAGIIASVIPVPDHATYPLMLALHDRLIAGDCLSAALVAARSTLDPDDPAEYAAGAAFIALGAG